MITQHPVPIGPLPRPTTVQDDGTTLFLFVLGIVCILAGRLVRGMDRTK